MAEVRRDEEDPEVIKEMRANLLAARQMAPKASSRTSTDDTYDFTTGQDIAHKTAQEISQLQAGMWGSVYNGKPGEYGQQNERLKELAGYMNDAGYDPYSIPVIQQGRLASRRVSNDTSSQG